MDIFTYSCCYGILQECVTAEISAASLLVNYWHPNVSNAVWVVMCIVVVVGINMLGAGAYGEAEFIFAWVVNQFRPFPLTNTLTVLSRLSQ